MQGRRGRLLRPMIACRSRESSPPRTCAVPACQRVRLQLRCGDELPHVPDRVTNLWAPC
jgi:hypothetical protein